MKATVRESVIEQYLVEQVKKLGGKAYKFSSPNNRGVPDRIVVLPTGIIFFVECKAPGKTLSPLQKLTVDTLVKLRAGVYIADSKESVNNLVHDLTKIIQRRQGNAQ